VEPGEVSHWVKTRENTYDGAFSNPPYFEPNKIKQPGLGRAHAYIETIDLETWLKAMIFAVKPRAPIVLIHRSAELARLLSGLDRWVGEIVVLPIAPFPGAEANRVLIRGRKGLRRGRVRLLAPLFVRDAEGADAFSDAMQAVKRGQKINWD
ncbi:MAG: SAM-dependent methyltransferase, partial [Pseudomonadota bacterium]